MQLLNHRATSRLYTCGTGTGRPVAGAAPNGDNRCMSGDHIPVPSLEDARDLEAAMGLAQELINSQALTPSILESRLGWPEGKIEQWLKKPYEARLVDYLRLMRQMAALILKRSESSEESRHTESSSDLGQAEPDIMEIF